MRIEIEKLKKEKENLLDYVEKKNQAIKELEDKCGQTEMNLRLVEQERDQHNKRYRDLLKYKDN